MYPLFSTRTVGRAFVGHVVGSAVDFFDEAQRSIARASTSRILSALSDDQLDDAGLERPAGPRPQIEVDARLMDRLMSMR